MPTTMAGLVRMECEKGVGRETTVFRPGFLVLLMALAGLDSVGRGKCFWLGNGRAAVK